MKTSRIYLDGLVVHTRYRKVDDERVAALAASMDAIGLQQPISVWAEPDKSGVETIHLVAGLHRVRAAEKLGWEQIDAVIIELTEIDRRRWEIAENLHRAELTALERDEHVAEWIKLTEQATEEAAAASEKDVRNSGKRKPGQTGPVSKGGRGKQSGVRQAARELNLPGKTEEARRHTARRAEKVASLTEEAKEVAREVGLDDNRTALLRAAEQPPERQTAAIREIAEAKAESKRRPSAGTATQPIPAPLTKLIEAASDVSDDPDHQLNLLIYAWEAASEETKRRFLRWVPSQYINGIAA